MPTPTKILLIGASAKPYAWSQMAHLPALKALGHGREGGDYTIASVSSSSAETAAAAKKIFEPSISNDEKSAFGDSKTACEQTKGEVDLAVISVNVQIHSEPCLAAANNGTTILCEWPLGKSIEDTTAIAQHAKEKGVKGYVMAQAIMQPALRYIKNTLLPKMGKVFSVNVTGHTPIWGLEVYYPYLVDRNSGGTMITIPMGHTIAGLRSIFGEIAKISAFASISRPSKPVMGAPAGSPHMDCTTYDTVSVSGRFASGAILSYNMRGDALASDGLIIEVQCENGHIKLVGDTSFAEYSQFEIFTAAHGKGYEAVEYPRLLEETGGDVLDIKTDCVARFYYHLRKILQAEKSHSGTADEGLITFTYEDAVKNYAVVDAILKSADADGQPIALL